MRVILVGLCGVALAWTTLPVKADVLSYCEAYARNQADKHLSGSAVLGSKPQPTAAQREKRKMLALADCLMLYAPKPDTKTVETKPELQPEKAESVTPDPVVTLRNKPIMTKPVIKAAAPEAEPEPETVTAISVVTPRSKPKTIVPVERKNPVNPAAKIEAATAVVPVQKKMPLADSASLVPGTPAWRGFCAAKYASYNPATDTYTARSGLQRPCRASKNQTPTRATKTQLPAPAAKSKLPTRAAKSQPLPEATKKKSVWDSFDNPGLHISR